LKLASDKPITLSAFSVIQVSKPWTFEAFTVPEISRPLSPITNLSNFCLSSGDTKP
jgi:hypothetical protein